MKPESVTTNGCAICGTEFFGNGPHQCRPQTTIPTPRGGIEHDWRHWALVYQRQLRKLKKLVAAEGYAINSNGDGMPTSIEKIP